MALTRLIARPMLASIFVAGAVQALRNAPQHAIRAKPVADRIVPLARRVVPQFPDDPVTLVRINAVVQLGSAAALATGRAPRLSSAVLAASLVPTTAAGHRFWEIDDEERRNTQRMHFFKNVSLIGGLIIAAGDTEGRPGVVWRARRATKDARREARHLAKAARREAKLAKAQLT